MTQAPEIDVDQLMEQIRASHEKCLAAVPPSPATASPHSGPEPTDLAVLQSGYDIYHLDFTSHRKLVGRFVVFVKSVLRQLLTPILERQLAFNAATARAATYLWEQAEATRQQQAVAIQTLRAEIAQQMEATRQHQESILQTLRQELEASGQQKTAALQALRTEMLEHVQAWGQWGQHMETRLSGIEQWGQHMETRLSGIEQTSSTLDRVQQDMRTHQDRALARLTTDHVLQERRLTVLLEEARKRLPGPLSQDQLQVFADEGKHVLDALYVSFEDQFRGTREDIKERFRVYLPLLRKAKLGSDAMPILDIGCGRGEWLELLQEEGLRVQGVDVNRVLVEECRGRGVEVSEGEALVYLSTIAPNSFGAVTGFHIIEHLPFEALIKLLDETVRVLKEGGIAIFETPNPENVLVGSCNFYLDPSHRNPLPSAMIKFIAEARGLCRVSILNLHPYPESCRIQGEGCEVAQRFNEHFYGPQDYAVVGWKV